jgi:hypothetical protein
MEINIEHVKEHWITINRSSFVNHFNEKSFDKSLSYWIDIFHLYTIISKNEILFDFDQLSNKQKIYFLFMLFWEKNLRTVFGDANNLATLKHGKEEVVISTQSELNNLEIVVTDFDNFVNLITITENMDQFTQVISGSEKIIKKVKGNVKKNKDINGNPYDIYQGTFENKHIKAPENFEISESDEIFYRKVRDICLDLIEKKIDFSSEMIEMVETLHSPKANPLRIQRFKEDNEQLMKEILIDFGKFQDFWVDFGRIFSDSRDYFPMDEDEKNIDIASLYMESERNKVLKDINKLLEKNRKHMERLSNDKDFLNGIIR